MISFLKPYIVHFLSYKTTLFLIIGGSLVFVISLLRLIAILTSLDCGGWVLLWGVIVVLVQVGVTISGSIIVFGKFLKITKHDESS